MYPDAPTRIGRYEVVNRLGEGGMGVLFLARDPRLDRIVAVKVLSVHNAELRARFAREARSAAALRHPNIVTIFDVGDDADGRPFIAMEYIEGETLAQLIARRATLPQTRKIEWVQAICSALGYAHRMGVIHRDVKPANVMVDTEGTLKVLDFGLARATTGHTEVGLTRAGAVLGTPNYMSPEQIEGRQVDHRSDIFAVGLVLYELLSYVKAYQGDTPYAVIHKILNTAPQPLGSLCPAIDPTLVTIVERAMHPDVSLRYPDLGQLQGDLGRVRARFLAVASDPTVIVDVPAPQAPVAAGPPSPPTPSPRPRTGPAARQGDMEAVARRRTAQIEEHLEAARRRLESGSYEAAVTAAEEAALLAPDDPRVLDLLGRAADAVELEQCHQWLSEATALMAGQELTAAVEFVQRAIALRPTMPEALSLLDAIEAQRREQAQAAERSRRAGALVEEAAALLARDDLSGALRAVSDALTHQPGHPRAQELLAAIQRGMLERDARELALRRVAETIARSERALAAGDLDGARRALLDVRHPSNEIEALRARIDAAGAAATEAEADRQRRAVEARSAEDARRAEQVRQAEADRLAQEARRLEDAHRAEEARRAREDQQRAFDALIGDAQTTLARGDADGALGHVTAALTLRPGDPRAQALIGAIRQAIADDKASVLAERRVLRSVAEARREIVSGDLAKAEAALSGADRQHPEVCAVASEIERARDAIARHEVETKRRERERREAHVGDEQARRPPWVLDESGATSAVAARAASSAWTWESDEKHRAAHQRMQRWLVGGAVLVVLVAATYAVYRYATPRPTAPIEDDLGWATNRAKDAPAARAAVPPADVPGPPQPAPAGPIPPAVDGIAIRARALLRAGRREEALQLLVGATDASSNAEIASMISELATDAARSSAAARVRAEKAGARSQSAFRQAVDREASVGSAAPAARIRGLWAAMELYGRAEADVGAFIASLRSQFSSGRRAQAIDEATRALRGEPSNPAVTPLVAQWRAITEQEASAARAAALGRGVSEQSSGFRTARGLEDTARRAGAPEAAVVGFIEAADGYRRLEREPPIAAVPTLSPGLARARAFIAQGRDQDALDVLSTSGALKAPTADVTALLTELAGRARARAETEASKARGKGAGDTPTFATGEALVQEARRAADAGDRVEAVRGYWSAAETFAKAERPATPPPPPALPAPANEAPAIETLFRRIEAAYASLDVDQVKTVLPNMPFADLTNLNKNLKNYESYRLSIQLRDLTLTSSGAIARCEERRIIKPKSGRTIDDTRRKTYHLIKAGTTWQVERYEYPQN